MSAAGCQRRERESDEEEREDGAERGRETTVLTAEIEACEEKSSGSKPRSYPISEEKKYSGSDDGTKRRDETHRGVSLLQKERIEFLPAFFRIAEL